MSGLGDGRTERTHSTAWQSTSSSKTKKIEQDLIAYKGRKIR